VKVWGARDFHSDLERVSVEGAKISREMKKETGVSDNLRIIVTTIRMYTS
jgi:uncharacterized protein (DUF1786 family)